MFIVLVSFDGGHFDALAAFKNEEDVKVFLNEVGKGEIVDGHAFDEKSSRTYMVQEVPYLDPYDINDASFIEDLRPNPLFNDTELNALVFTFTETPHILDDLEDVDIIAPHYTPYEPREPRAPRIQRTRRLRSPGSPASPVHRGDFQPRDFVLDNDFNSPHTPATNPDIIEHNQRRRRIYRSPETPMSPTGTRAVRDLTNSFYDLGL